MAIKPNLTLKIGGREMKKIIEVKDTSDFTCKECGGDLVQDSSDKNVAHCTMCSQVFKYEHTIDVTTILVMEDSDMIKDDSGIGWELREMLDNM